MRREPAAPTLYKVEAKNAYTKPLLAISENGKNAHSGTRWHTGQSKHRYIYRPFRLWRGAVGFVFAHNVF